MESWRLEVFVGRYFYDPVKDKEEKANRTWKYLTPADREKISLDDFTKQVNERQGGSYEPFEFKTILEKLQMGRTINENRSLSGGPVAGRSKPRYKVTVRLRRIDIDQPIEVWVCVENKCPHKNTWTLISNGSVLRLGSSG